MSVKELEKDGFVYLAYHRKGYEDFLLFRKALVHFLQSGSKHKDIVIDMTKNSSISEIEIALLANTVRQFQGSERQLRIIASRDVRAKLEAINLFMAGNSMIFESHEALLETLNIPRDKTESADPSLPSCTG
ncbi:MAG: hypothetical protein JXA71_02310 [Chitinispirillaceae bacterium]|nr:hypothetical protein [Chitinispirillaceae bacterium]